MLELQEANDTIQEMRELANTGISRCIQCGRCSANCPAAKEMDVLPNKMVWALIQGDAETLTTAHSPWKCLSCFTCASRCPRGVSPANVMEAARLTIIRQQGRNRLAAETLEHFDPEIPQQAFVAAFRKFNK